jgi:primosomal protein N' (replication factor Y)
MFVKVVVAKPLYQRFTYAFDPSELPIEIGMRLIVPFGTKELKAFAVEISETVEPSSYEIKSVKKIVDDLPIFTSHHIQLALWMSKLYLCSEGEALSAMIPSNKREMSEDLFPEPSFTTTTVREEQLSDEQRKAIDTIYESTQPLHYLYGVTGSGKTEVFFHLAEKVIQEKKEVIYLVPEITLTYQLSQQISSRFNKRVAILHSKMTGNQRLNQWRRIQRKEVDIVIGARSAIFAPFDNVGLIIIDEEHENTYKAGNTPRYHARQVAQKIASMHNAKIVMGSATPSLEAWQMIQENHIVQHTLSNRVAGGSMPTVEIVDMLNEREMLSRTLSKEIEKTLKNKRQVILFLNRRGFSYFFHCNSCGYEMMCPHCSVALTYHKSENTMVCHYCNYTTRPISVCPDCKSLDVGYGGFGTQMVEQEIHNKFPLASIVRLDADVNKKRGEGQKILESFQKGEIDILLGTQMVAKGLNFPKVDLVGIVLADSTLNLPDFRSAERTFSLIVQVSGRSGRYNSDGKVIVQTYHADNPAIQLATKEDKEEFYLQELETRKETNFPPFSRLVNIVIRGKRKDVCEQELKVIGSIAERALTYIKDNQVEILGLSECPIEKINNNYRYHLILRSNSFTSLLQVVTYIHRSYTPRSSVYLEIDIDPLHLL